MKHAVEHASTDLGATAKMQGFRKGKVPQKVLEARVGARPHLQRRRSRATSAAGSGTQPKTRARCRAVSQPQLKVFDVPTCKCIPLSFGPLAEVAVQPAPEVPQLATPSRFRLPSPKCPGSGSTAKSRRCARRSPSSSPSRAARRRTATLLVVDLVDETGEAQRDASSSSSAPGACFWASSAACAD